jgi:hypothetical protein
MKSTLFTTLLALAALSAVGCGGDPAVGDVCTDDGDCGELICDIATDATEGVCAEAPAEEAAAE